MELGTSAMPRPETSAVAPMLKRPAQRRVALGPLPRFSRAKLTFMFLSHKQFAGPSSGNKWPLFAATVAHSGAILKSAEQRL